MGRSVGIAPPANARLSTFKELAEVNGGCDVLRTDRKWPRSLSAQLVWGGRGVQGGAIPQNGSIEQLYRAPARKSESTTWKSKASARGSRGLCSHEMLHASPMRLQGLNVADSRQAALASGTGQSGRFFAEIARRKYVHFRRRHTSPLMIGTGGKLEGCFLVRTGTYRAHVLTNN